MKTHLTRSTVATERDSPPPEVDAVMSTKFEPTTLTHVAVVEVYRPWHIAMELHAASAKDKRVQANIDPDQFGFLSFVML
jgi:hypothetical protein